MKVLLMDNVLQKRLLQNSIKKRHCPKDGMRRKSRVSLATKFTTGHLRDLGLSIRIIRRRSFLKNFTTRQIRHSRVILGMSAINTYTKVL